MTQLYDLIIIGSGPAGLAAAVYAQRARLNTLILEKAMVSGGQVLTTYEVDNYPGLPGIGGYDLGLKFREHADRLGALFKEDVSGSNDLRKAVFRSSRCLTHEEANSTSWLGKGNNNSVAKE